MITPQRMSEFEKNKIIDMFLNKINRNKMLLNNPDILDVYLKIKGLPD